MVDPRHVLDGFGERFGGTHDVRIFRAPGRVNLIGEHTDYNEGFVMPIAIDRDTVIAARSREDNCLRIYSANLDEQLEFATNAGEIAKWGRYILGMASILSREGAHLRGMDAVIESDVPVGAGLSSSAALEVVSGYALLRLSHEPIDKLALALAGQKAEHEFVGTQVGIMDQYVSAMGVHDAALLIDCRTLESTTIPIDTSETAIVVCDSGVKHDLAASAYNDRRKECEEAVRLLKVALPGITALRDVTLEEWKAHEELLSPSVRQRARHVVTENARALAAAEALRSNHMREMGELMYGSHESLRLDYEVTVQELDVLVEETKKIPGVYGSRMTGGGFGGCTVSMMRREVLGEFHDRMTRAYRAAFDRDLKIYPVEIVNGVEEVVL